MEARTSKAQSAMEYLSNYIYLIIIAAIILAVLFYLGIFNTSAPRAHPGECYVYRPDGKGTLYGVNLVGVCQGELPQFVSRYDYGSSFQEFGNSNVTVPRVNFTPLMNSTNGQRITMTGWVLSGVQGNTQTAFAYGNFSGYTGPPYEAIFINSNQRSPLVCNGGLFVAMYGNYTCITNTQIPLNTWIFVAVVYNGTYLNGYAVTNGNMIAASKKVKLPSSFKIPAHSSVLISTPWNGLISNVQLYNNSLSENGVYQLYKEGLGGSPINLKNLVGWWPLNGNLQDYSGNGDDGYAYNSALVSGSWYSNYSAP